MKFEVGKSYWTRSICDSECIHTLAVVARTAKMVTVSDSRGTRKLRVFIDYNGHEAVRPYGNYSMAAVISADDEGTGPAPKPEPASILKRPAMTHAEMAQRCAGTPSRPPSAELRMQLEQGSVCLPDGSQWLWDARFNHWACTRGPRVPQKL